MTTSAVYCGNFIALVETKWGGFQRYFYVDTRDTSVASHLMHGKPWEAWISNAIAPLVAGTTFIDLGANVGWFTVLALHHGAEEAVVVEANMNLCVLLEKTLAVNGFFRDKQVQLLCKAVSSKSGEFVELHQDAWFIAGASTAWESSDSRAPKNLPDSVYQLEERYSTSLVETLAVDSLALPKDKRYFMKLDVEGAEESAINGAWDLITGCPDIQLLIEYNGLSVELGARLQAEGFLFQHLLESTESKRRPLTPSDFPGLKQGDMIYAYRIQG